MGLGRVWSKGPSVGGGWGRAQWVPHRRVFFKYFRREVSKSFLDLKIDPKVSSPPAGGWVALDSPKNPLT